MAPTITRYKKQGIDATTEIERLGGMADKAAAQGQAGIAAQQKGLAAKHGQRAAQEVQSFAQRLNTFSNSMNSMMAADAQIRGQQSGVKDAAQRRKEVMDLQVKYADKPEILQAKIAELQTATEQDNFSVYGRVYQDTVNKSYVNQVEVDAVNAAKHAQNVSGGNPELFKEAYTKYAEKYVMGAPNEMGAIAATKAFEKHSVSVYESMYSTQWTKWQTDEQNNINSNIKALQSSIEDAANTGDNVRVAQAQGQLNALVNSQVQSHKMGVEEAKWIVTDSYRKAQVGEFLRYGNSEAANGQGWKFIGRLRDPHTKEGKAFAALPVKSQSEVIAKVERASKSFQDSTIAKEEFDNKAVRTFQETNSRGYKQVIGKTGKRMTPGELADLEADGSLGAKDVKDILDYQSTRTDKDVLLKFKDGGLLVNMSVDDIMTLDDISPDDKAALIKQREGALKNPNYDWLKSREGQRALDYLAEDYDVPADGVAQILAAVKGEKTPKQQDYIDARRELIRRVESFPYADQPQKAMEIYNEVKKTSAEKTTTEKADRRETNILAQISKFKARSLATEESTFSFSKTPLEILDEERKIRAKRGFAMPEYDEIKARLEGTFKPSAQPRIPTKPRKPLTIYKPPAVKYEQRAAEFGYSPKITGKNVDLVRVRANIKRAAYPILKKYGVGIKDGFRYTPGNGATRSRHLSGNALDVTWTGKTKAEKAEMIQDFKRAGFSGFGVGYNTLHIDMRKSPASWSYIGGTATGGGKMPAWARQAIEG